MKFRVLHRLLAAAIIALFSIPAIAQYSRDSSANQKIDEAINNHYLMMELDKAEDLLTGTISACEDKCSPGTKAKAWMYVGIVRGSGKQDQAGAADAFSQAKGLDPGIQLDGDLASEETKATFASAAGSSSAAAAAPADMPALPPEPASTGAAPGPAPPPAGAPGDMLCSPQGAPIGLNMPIPISCTSNANIAEGFIKFQEPGATDWKKISLDNNSGQWQTTIPCQYTASAGVLKFYVGVKDRSGEYVDQFGSKRDPAFINLAANGVAPAFPGDAPVAACAADGSSASDCPPDFPGCSTGSSAVCGDLDWGAACRNSSQCKCGLLCEDGQCATAPTCSADEECDTGACVDGYCSALAEDSSSAGPFKRHWLSLTAGMDLMPYGGKGLCTETQAQAYGTQCYRGDPVQRWRQADDAESLVGTQDGGVGLTAGQLRIKLGYDYAFTHHFVAGVRLGVAFLNTRPKVSGESPYLPLHLAARAGWTFTSLSHDGFRPTVYVEGGYAESDGRAKSQSEGIETNVYKVGGLIFAAPGVQLGYAVKDSLSINLDVQYMLLFPTGNFAGSIHPALNLTYGL